MHRYYYLLLYYYIIILYIIRRTHNSKIILHLNLKCRMTPIWFLISIDKTIEALYIVLYVIIYCCRHDNYYTYIILSKDKMDAVKIVCS